MSSCTQPTAQAVPEDKGCKAARRACPCPGGWLVLGCNGAAATECPGVLHCGTDWKNQLRALPEPPAGTAGAGRAQGRNFRRSQNWPQGNTPGRQCGGQLSPRKAAMSSRQAARERGGRKPAGAAAPAAGADPAAVPEGAAEASAKAAVGGTAGGLPPDPGAPGAGSPRMRRCASILDIRTLFSHSVAQRCPSYSMPHRGIMRKSTITLVG